jgi:hypothetical protein
MKTLTKSATEYWDEDIKFINDCFDSLAKNKPIAVEDPRRGVVTCIEFLLNVNYETLGNYDGNVSPMYQFHRADIDFSKQFCTDDNGNSMDCISRICEFHMNLANRLNTKGSKDFGHFFDTYLDLIKQSKCEIVRGERTHGEKEISSCLNLLIETKPRSSLGWLASWINERDAPYMENSAEREMCDILKSKSDWLTALAATETEHGSARFHSVYNNCFNSKYPDPFGHTLESRKIYDFLCYEDENLDNNELVKSIVGIEPGNTESIDKAFDIKPDTNGIVGVYNINTNESWNEEEIEQYVHDVSNIWYGTSSTGGALKNLLGEASEVVGDRIISNVGTRDNPIKAYTVMTLYPEPNVEYHDIFQTISDVKTRGDFKITLRYFNETTEKEIYGLEKIFMFADIITDLPKGIKTKINKTNPKLFNKMQNVANATRVRKPSAGGFKLVISNKSADIARCTTCQPWENKSCLSLSGGCFRGAVKTYAHFGSYIAYLVKDSPYEPTWLGRLLIHKCDNGELSIQDEKSHYTTKPKYWGIVYDAVRTIFADKGINPDPDLHKYCQSFAWSHANDNIETDFSDLCEEGIQSILDNEYDMPECIKNCMETTNYNKNKVKEEDKARNKCVAECEREIRGNFDCRDYIFSRYEDEEDPPFYIDYTDTAKLQHIEKNGSVYNTILKQRISELDDSGKFVKKISDTF